MEESVTYQAIMRRGAAEGIEEARTTLLQLGTVRFGQPNARTTKAIEALADVHELHGLIRRVLDVESWEELLPARRPGNHRRSR